LQSCDSSNLSNYLKSQAGVTKMDLVSSDLSEKDPLYIVKQNALSRLKTHCECLEELFSKTSVNELMAS